MRWSVILSFAAATAAASSQAQANYQIIRWTSGYCHMGPVNSTKPFPSDYKAGRKTFKTFGAATPMRAQLIAQRQCW